jgi:hypothetical protein
MDYKRMTTRIDENSVAIEIRKFNLEDGLTREEQDWEAMKKMLFRLAELEDKIENGTLVELPCKVGDTVWEVYEDVDCCVELQVREVVALKLYKIIRWMEDGVFGAWVFLTKAEAESKLKELQGGRK